MTKKTCILSVGEHVMSIVDTVLFKINVGYSCSYVIIKESEISVIISLEGKCKMNYKMTEVLWAI